VETLSFGAISYEKYLELVIGNIQVKINVVEDFEDRGTVQMLKFVKVGDLIMTAWKFSLVERLSV